MKGVALACGALAVCACAQSRQPGECVRGPDHTSDCPAGQRCVPTDEGFWVCNVECERDGDPCPGIGYCRPDPVTADRPAFYVCYTGGSLGFGEPCTGDPPAFGEPSCGPRLLCLDWSGRSMCMSFCLTPAAFPCPGGGVCVWGLCTLPCDPADPGSCPDAAICVAGGCIRREMAANCNATHELECPLGTICSERCFEDLLNGCLPEDLRCLDPVTYAREHPDGA